ncbi:M20 family metallo-hydrolase [Amycolatopsis anabasis]|uniref:M20 family metallo-hydrolase n=1 Tax=Amycolatopsis anabasis TaxID=1840409 RepID=UPI00131D479A|nr:M20 family metallo-hydrolase [Amycolatopsis anabasis]
MNAADRAVLDDFHALSALGATEAGGVERQAATEADRQTREWLVDWLTTRGFTTTVDRIGNLFGLREWTPGAPFVLVGSHLDSQPRGGRYDGAYGVLAAAHAVQRVHERFASSGETPPFNAAVVNWFNEEGSRFKPSMMGSAVYTGKMPLEEALAVTDLDGVSVEEALARIGFLGEQDGPRAAFAAEIHIEQGRVLDKEGIQIGLVESNWAAHKYQISVVGAQSHTGSTVMADRQDALLGAARVIVAVRELVDRFPDTPLHTSAGQLFVHPNSPVVVAREAELHLDLRSESLEVLQEADAILNREFAAIEASTNVKIVKKSAHFWPVNPYQPEGVELAREAAEALGLSHRPMLTLAGHDSTNLKDIVPTVMLFVPSVEGISHNEHEFTHDEDICAGVNLLTEVVARLCRGDLRS